MGLRKQSLAVVLSTSLETIHGRSHNGEETCPQPENQVFALLVLTFFFVYYIYNYIGP